MSLRLRSLRLLGAGRDYGVDFTDSEGAVRPLSVIAGEISTGKTSVLEFVDYCLGGGSHPKHIEIQRRVRAVLLEVEIEGELAVIERRVFTSDQHALVHRCGLDDLREPHTTEVRPLAPAGDPESLSAFLLSATGLAGLKLKEAPTQADSGTDPLSFRDVMPLCFLTNQRMDNKNLLFEATPMRNLKLVQVIEILFEVYDDQLAAMSEQLAQLLEERQGLGAEIAALDTFLAENDVPGRMELSASIDTFDRQLQDRSARLDSLSQEMQAATTYAADARARYSELHRMSALAAARVRDRETLMRRLLPLRGQYAEDERKLVFFQEANQIFDPLRVRVCPACMQQLPAPVEVHAGGTCSLCQQHIPAQDEPVDITAERLAVRARLHAIDRYIEEVESQLAEASAEYDAAVQSETAAQRALDDQVGQDLSPYIAQRDELIRERESIRASQREQRQALQWRDGLERRRADAARIEERITELRHRIEELRSSRPDREAVMGDLSERFAEILRAFGFPKLDEPEPPYLSGKFVPFVRGNRYSEVGSTGALTLISMAWELAIFERAIEQGQPHPGFLLIDSPQKNLKPESTPDESDEVTDENGDSDDFRDPAIPRRVWEHLEAWSRGVGLSSQLVVVDNLPSSIVDDHVVVRYSGRADAPQYGLIDDEIG